MKYNARALILTTLTIVLVNFPTIGSLFPSIVFAGPSHARSKAFTASAKSKKANHARAKTRAAAKANRTAAVKNSARNSARARRLAARRLAEARRRAILARIRATDNRLLHTSQDRIENDQLPGEDLRIRQLAQDALGNNPGTVVVLDSNTGRVLSMVNQAWAVGKPFKPCSTIKLLTSWAALNEGMVDPDAPLPVGRSTMTMTEALAHSNNEYFQELGERLGYDRILKYAHEMGFGERTGINFPGEAAGSLPTPENDLRRMSSHGDGYGITALQLATFTAALANGGTFYKPQVVRTEQELKAFQPVVVRKLKIAEKDRAKILEGMLAAVSYGTARRSQAAVLQVAGKTGSCNCDGSPVTRLGLFTSFINPAHPGLVVSVITTGSAQRGALASIVAGNIYNGLSGVNPIVNTSGRPRRVEPLRVERDAHGHVMLTNHN